MGLCCAALSMMLATHLSVSASTPPPAIEPSLLIPNEPSRHGASPFNIYTSTFSTANPAPNADGLVSHEDWKGVWLDTGVVLGSQVVVVGALYLLPESVSGWSDEQKDESFAKYGRNFVHPAFDKDKFYINYILHPYWGGAYYTRARERGLEEGHSFMYSVLMSTMYEFGVECFFEKPSIQDMVVTPVVGSVIGKYLFEPMRQSIKSKEELHWYDEALLLATDPIGILSTGVENMLGIRPSISVSYPVRALQKDAVGSAVTTRGNPTIITLQFPME